MKAHNDVIDMLNEVLAAELVAINQYFLHAKMCDNWGYKRLAKHNRDESIDEMKHAERVINRILYLEGLPNLQRLDALSIGQTVVEQFQNDVQLEYRAVARLNEYVDKLRKIGDNGTEALLKDILVDEEEHVDWLETQLSLVKQLGETGYLAEQMKD